jgi:parallel beta-helix repeat protein
MHGNRCGAVLLATVAIILLVFEIARAADCGGSVPCACGDNVRKSTTLVADLSNCRNGGLRLRAAVVLDCAGHTITGSGRDEGIVVDSVSGAEVRNCNVSRFDRGIRIRGGQGNWVHDNQSFQNDNYGVDLAVATTGNRIEANLIRDNGDEGIHVGSDANDNQITGNQILRSERENLYLLSVHGVTVTGNTLADSGSAALYVKHSSDNVFADNQILDGVVQLRGTSSGNFFTGNALEGAGYVFQAYNDSDLGWTFPHDNTVEGGSIFDASTCFRFEGSYDNQATDVVTDGCRPMTQKSLGGVAATGNSVSVIRMR